MEKGRGLDYCDIAPSEASDLKEDDLAALKVQINCEQCFRRHVPQSPVRSLATETEQACGISRPKALQKHGYYWFLRENYD